MLVWRWSSPARGISGISYLPIDVADETGEYKKSLKYDENGLVPAVLQDVKTGEVLMVAWMNEEALDCTIEMGEAHFWSRSRKCLWRKGETSGHVMTVHEIKVDCDLDTLVLRVEPAGPACHTGERTCFYRNLEEIHAA